MKDLVVGGLYAKEFGYRAIRRVRVDEIILKGRSVDTIHISYGPGFKKTAEVSKQHASYEFLDTWEDHRRKEVERKALKQRAADLHKCMESATKLLGVDCRVTPNLISISGDMDKLEELARCLEEAGLSPAKPSALDSLLGSSE